MIKLIPRSGYSHPELLQSCLVKISSNGKLRGNDLSDFIKQAGHRIAEYVKQAELFPGEELALNVMLGCTEKHNVNKNGDGFDEKTCEAQHHTFVTDAKAYRNHRNRDPLQSYGHNKASFYNKPMGRVEVLTAYYGTKEAAEHGKGLVADKELDRLHSGRDLALSMAAKVPIDYCSGCNNPARSRDEYCTEETCKYGGLKDHIGEVYEDGHVLHANNPNARFFDSSFIENDRQADRIAHSLGLVKKALDDSDTLPSKCGAALAEDLRMALPEYLLPSYLLPTQAKLAQIAYRLAEYESRVSNEEVNRAFDTRIQKPVDGIEKHADIKQHREAVYNALAQSKASLSFPDFLSLVTGQPRSATEGVAKVAALRLSYAYRDLISDPLFESELMKCETYSPTATTAGAVIGQYIQKNASDYRLSQEAVVSRMRHSELLDFDKAHLTKSAEFVETTQDENRLAREYALYKLAFLSYWSNSPDLPYLSEMVVRQNALA